MKHFYRVVAALVLTAALLATPCLADTIGGATVTGSNVRLRSEADTTTITNILTEMPQGAFLLVEERLGGWYKVVYNGVTGYVSADYAAFAQALDGAYSFAGATKGTNVNLRSAASTGSSVVKTLPTAGTQLVIKGVDGQWLKVADPSGATGYIRSDLLEYSSASAAVPPAAPIVAVSTKGQQLVQTAIQYKGYPYTWGGMSPATGFDCSGFANYVCSQYGISLHRVAQDIYNNDGTWVSKDALQSGDLLFFGYGAGCITHMGIYVGNGQMIHASTSSTGVIYSDINSNYYTRMYVGAKRVA